MNETQSIQKPDLPSAGAMIGTLGSIAMISGFLVVLVYQFTLPIINENKREALERAVFKVVPQARQQHYFSLDEQGLTRLSEDAIADANVFAGYDTNGKLAGIALEASAPGYQDAVRTLYGYSPACECIVGITVLESKETPGLGDKVETDARFLANFEALDARLNTDKSAMLHDIETVKHGTKTEPWQIDAISGATITSKAIGRGLRESTRNVPAGADQASGSTRGRHAMNNDPNQVKPITWDTFLPGIWRENPVFVMLLGMCPVLAVTNSVLNAIAMGLATTFVLLCSSTLVSLMRHWIPRQVRIASYIVIIATFVTIVDYAIQAISLDLYKALGAFIQLIVANCIILGRAEAFASKNTVPSAIINALGMGAGFTIALLCLGSVRELLGSGTLLGLPVLAEGFQPWVVMILPPGGFFVLGAWLLLFSWLKARQARKTQRKEAVHAT